MAAVKNVVDEYISQFPPSIQDLLQQMRMTIRQAAPGAEEVIKYAIPTYMLNGMNVVHFAGFKQHIGFYPVPSGIDAFRVELSAYKGAKGSVQFPLDKPLPLDLVARIVKYRVKESEEKAVKKKQKRTCKNGHTYYKSSDCPTCPVCEADKKPSGDFLAALGAPAKRALESRGIGSLQQLAVYTEKDILQLHGVGPGSIPKLKAALQAAGLNFRKN